MGNGVVGCRGRCRRLLGREVKGPGKPLSVDFYNTPIQCGLPFLLTIPVDDLLEVLIKTSNKTGVATWGGLEKMFPACRFDKSVAPQRFPLLVIAPEGDEVYGSLRLESKLLETKSDDGEVVGACAAA